ncbi:LPS translocon maturation chaperone LptM [Faucicola atlantae]|uniref:LPS translocon maturation chaperone LptM n=1 Tax=Faucicola atlantae TaxID=34059 RepID=UPI0025B1EBA7|nr:lipoprotein [Moraxella atlantae]
MPNGFFHHLLPVPQHRLLRFALGVGMGLTLIGCGQKGDLYLPERTSAALNTADPATQPTNQSLADNPNVTYQTTSQTRDAASAPAATPATSASPFDPAMIQDDRNAY